MDVGGLTNGYFPSTDGRGHMSSWLAQQNRSSAQYRSRSERLGSVTLAASSPHCEHSEEPTVTDHMLLDLLRISHR